MRGQGVLRADASGIAYKATSPQHGPAPRRQPEVLRCRPRPATRWCRGAQPSRGVLGPDCHHGLADPAVVAEAMLAQQAVRDLDKHISRSCSRSVSEPGIQPERMHCFARSAGCRATAAAIALGRVLRTPRHRNSPRLTSDVTSQQEGGAVCVTLGAQAGARWFNRGRMSGRQAGLSERKQGQ